MRETSSDPGFVPAAPGPAGQPKKRPCAITGRATPRRDLVSLETIRPSLADRIRQDFPSLAQDALISRAEVARYRSLYVEELLQAEHGEITELDRQVAESIARQDTIAENTEEGFDGRRTFGERLSDRLADFGGAPTGQDVGATSLTQTVGSHSACRFTKL